MFKFWPPLRRDTEWQNGSPSTKKSVLPSMVLDTGILAPMTALTKFLVPAPRKACPLQKNFPLRGEKQNISNYSVPLFEKEGLGEIF